MRRRHRADATDEPRGRRDASPLERSGDAVTGCGQGSPPAAGGVVRLPPTVRDAVLDHARRALPNECCGLLIGGRAGTDTRITRAWPARNLRRSPTRYLIDPADHFAAIRAGRAAGQSVVGAYHSHPASPASPSATDIREADDTALVYVIASPARAEVRAYRLDAGRLRRVELHVARDSEDFA